MGCYIWYSEERGPSLPSPLLAVPNVTAHPSTASLPITVSLLYNGPLLSGFNAGIKGLMAHHWLLELSHFRLSLYDAFWLASAAQIRARVPNAPRKDFTRDAVPATTLSIYQGLDPPAVCWIAYSTTSLKLNLAVV